MSYAEMKHYLENHRDLFMLSCGRLHLATNSGTIEVEPRRMELLTSGYKVYEDSVPAKLLEIQRRPGRRKLQAKMQIEDRVEEEEEEVAQVPCEDGRKLVPFFRFWKHDLEKVVIDSICFTRNMQTAEQSCENYTPSYVQSLYKPVTRFIFNEHLLTRLTHPGEEYEVGSATLFLRLFDSLFEDEKEANYIRNWIAHLLQFPESRIVGTCLAILSRLQGTGKSTFVNCIADLLGCFAKKITNLYEELFNNFTNVMNNAFLIVIDDSNSKVFEEQFEALKHLITAESTRIRKLYMEEMRVPSSARFIVVSNNELILKLEEGDRRTAAFLAAARLHHNTHFFEQFAEYWKQRRNRRATLLYFLNHQIDPDWHPERSYQQLNSKFKRQLEAPRIPPLHIFCYSFALALFKDARNKLSNQDFVDIQSRPFCVAYRNWLVENQQDYPGEFRKLSQKQFPTQLRSLNILNTKELLHNKKHYGDAAYYRMQVLPFAKKAAQYEFEPLEARQWPSQFKAIKCKKSS